MQLQTLASILKEYRLDAGLTQEGLAERSGISARAISDLERGLYQAPHRDTVDRLVEALGLSPEQQAQLEAAISRSRGPTLAAAKPELPTGVLTLLMTEVEGSGELWEQFPEQMHASIAQHDSILNEAIEAHDGLLMPLTGAGDCRLGVFRLASDAVASAVEAQRKLHAAIWPTDTALRVRLALYSGEADVRDGAYFGTAVRRCTRLRALAAPGQSLMADSVWVLARGTIPVGVIARDLGEHQLTDHGQSERIIELIAPGLTADFPPLRESTLRAHYEMLLRALLDGRVVIFVGDGLNLTGRSLGEGWRPGQHDGLPGAGDLAAALAEGFGYFTTAPAELTRVAQYVSTLIGSGPLYEALHDLLDADYRPTIAHHLLASLPVDLARRGPLVRAPLIVTTSYDQGIERAFAIADQPLDVVAYIAEGEQRGRFVHHSPDGRARLIDKPNKYLGLSDSRAILLKVHGAIDRANPEDDSFVVTEDHFLDYMTGGDLSALVPVTIAARFRRSHFLFLGYSLRDWSQRVILRRVWGEQRLTYKSWAIHTSTAEPIERGLWRERGVDVLDVRLADYLVGLDEQIQALPLANGVA